MDVLLAQKREVEIHLADKENTIVKLNERAENIRSKLNRARENRVIAEETVTQRDRELRAQCNEIEKLKQDHSEKIKVLQSHLEQMRQDNAMLVAEGAVKDEKLTQAANGVKSVEKAHYETDRIRQEKGELENTLKKRVQEFDTAKDEAKIPAEEVRNIPSNFILGCCSACAPCRCDPLLTTCT